MKTNRLLFAIVTIGIVALSLNSCKEDNTSWYEEVVVTTGDCVETSSASITIANNRIDFAGHEKESLSYGVVFVINDNSSKEEIKKMLEDYSCPIQVKNGGKIEVYYDEEPKVFVQSDNMESGVFSVTLIGVPHDCNVSFASYCLDMEGSRKPIVGEIKQVNIPKLVLNCNFESEMLYGSCSCASISCEVQNEIKESEEYEFFILSTKSSDAVLMNDNWEFAASDYDYIRKTFKVDYSISNNKVFIQKTIYDLDFDTDYYITIYAARKKSKYTLQVGKSEQYILHTPKFSPVVKAYSVSQSGTNCTLTGYFMASQQDLESCSFKYYLYSGAKLMQNGKFDKNSILNNSGFDTVTIPLSNGQKYSYVAKLSYSDSENNYYEIASDTLTFIAGDIE